MDRVWVFGVALLALGLVCGIVSISMDYWYYQNVAGDKNDIYFGLWRFCGYYIPKQRIVCRSWDNFGKVYDISWLHACEAMMVIGGIENALALGLAIFSTWLKVTFPRKTWTFLVLFGCTCYTTTAFIFGFKHVDILPTNVSGGHFHAGFGLAIVAAILNLVCAVLLGRGPSAAGYEHI